MSTTHTFRPDYVGAEVVEAGIEVADRKGADSAAAYLSQRGVAAEVIQRVVTEPGHRRNPGRLRSRDERLIEEGTRFKYKL
jgi:hypothetical protein